MCWTYILHSKQLDRYYIGHTCSPLEERIKKHLSNHKGFTGKAKDWILVYSKQHENKTQAYQQERNLKKWKSKTRILEFIQKS